MNKLTAKYQVKVPSIIMAGEEVLKLEPIKLQTSVGEITIYPPGREDRQPESYIAPEKGFPKATLSVPGSKLWDADTLWIDIETNATPEFPKEEQRKLERKMHELIFRLLKLLRRKLPEMPMSLPRDLLPTTVFQWEPQQAGQLISSVPTSPFVVRVISQEASLTKDKWAELQQEMRSEEYTELYEDFIADSKAALDEDDLNRATIYAAIACEIFIKEYTEKAAKEKGISQIFWEYLKDPNTETRVRTYYDQVLHLVKGHSMKRENKETYNRLDRIFKARNKIMHEGKIPSSWNRDRINQLREDIREVEQIISWVREL
jgi:hypothetical protein